MTNQHPIAPPEELRDEWESEWHHQRGQDTYEEFMAKQAARWGADQELEACCEWLTARDLGSQSVAPCLLRAARRPKPPSLKEQALEALTKIEDNKATYLDSSVIRRALETIPDEQNQRDISFGESLSK